MTDTATPSTHELVRVRVDELRPEDVLAGSSRTIVTTPGRDAQTPRRHVQIVVRTAVGEQRVVRWRANTRVYVRRPVSLPAPGQTSMASRGPTPDPSSPDFVFCAIPFVDVGCARCDHRPGIHGKVLVGCEHAHCGCRAYYGDAFVVVDWCALAADHDGVCVPSGDPWIVATSIRTWQHVRAATPV